MTHIFHPSHHRDHSTIEKIRRKYRNRNPGAYQDTFVTFREEINRNFILLWILVYLHTNNVLHVMLLYRSLITPYWYNKTKVLP